MKCHCDEPDDDLLRTVLGLGGHSVRKTHYPSLRARLAELEKLREQLERSEGFLAQAQRLSHTGSFGLNATTRELYWSEETFRIFEYEPALKPTLDLVFARIHPEDRDRARRVIEQAIQDAGDYEHEYRLLTPEGKVKWLHTRAHAGKDSSGGIEFIGAVVDFTERRNIEEAAARRIENELRDVINTIPAIVWSASPDGARDFVNQRWQEYTGLPTEAGLGWGWTANVHPASVDRYMSEWRDALARGQPMEAEARVRRADGEYRWWLIRVVPRKDEHGNILKWFGTAIDIEDRKRAEQERETLQANLAHVNRISILGELAASVAHELKQPIAAASLNAEVCLQLLRRDPPNLQKVCKALTAITESADSAADIIDRLRALYKKSPPKREPVEVNSTIRQVVALILGEAGRHGVSMRTDLGDALPTVMADRVQLQQVLMNLVLNGIEAMQETGGILTLRSQINDGNVLISVSDTGAGLPTDGAEQIFEPFFTTKPQGSGMGLAISRSIVESHSGRIWATSNDERGASFHFSFPISTEAAKACAAGSKQRPAR
jgi:PAS domain S-box-containing protein